MVGKDIPYRLFWFIVAAGIILIAGFIISVISK